LAAVPTANIHLGVVPTEFPRDCKLLSFYSIILVKGDTK